MLCNLDLLSRLHLKVTVILVWGSLSLAYSGSRDGRGEPAVKVEIVKPHAKDQIPPGKEIEVEGIVRLAEGAAPPQLVVLHLMRRGVDYSSFGLRLDEDDKDGRYIKRGDKEYRFSTTLKRSRFVGTYEIHAEGVHAQIDPAGVKAPVVTRYDSPRVTIEIKR